MTYIRPLVFLSILGACAGGGGGNSGGGGGNNSNTTPNGVFALGIFTFESAEESLATSGPTQANLSTASDGSLQSDNTLLADNFEGIVGLKHSTYGLWANEKSESVELYAASFGSVTPRSDLPRNDATYAGSSLGVSRDEFYRSSFVTSSDMDIAVTNDFRDVSIESSNTVLRDIASDDTFVDRSYDFTGNGQVDGSGFSVTVQNDPSWDGIFELDGTATGNFYGPNAAEVGGVFNMQSPDGSGYIGAYGASRTGR